METYVDRKMWYTSIYNNQNWETTKCPSMSEWINLHPMEYYLVIKRNKLLIQATTWMNHKGIMLNERSQSQKVTCHMIPLKCILKKVYVTIAIENRSLFVRG